MASSATPPMRVLLDASKPMGIGFFRLLFEFNPPRSHFLELLQFIGPLAIRGLPPKEETSGLILDVTYVTPHSPLGSSFEGTPRRSDSMLGVLGTSI